MYFSSGCLRNILAGLKRKWNVLLLLWFLPVEVTQAPSGLLPCAKGRFLGLSQVACREAALASDTLPPPPRHCGHLSLTPEEVGSSSGSREKARRGEAGHFHRAAAHSRRFQPFTNWRVASKVPIHPKPGYQMYEVAACPEPHLLKTKREEIPPRWSRTWLGSAEHWEPQELSSCGKCVERIKEKQRFLNFAAQCLSPSPLIGVR